MVIRAKFQDYVTRFVQLAAQYEEQTHGQTYIGINRQNTPESSKYLGTGLVFSDEASRAREIAVNASRIEGWRATTSYQYLKDVRVHLEMGGGARLRNNIYSSKKSNPWLYFLRITKFG
jgi:hypothetical protein